MMMMIIAKEEADQKEGHWWEDNNDERTRRGTYPFGCCIHLFMVFILDARPNKMIELNNK